MSLLICRMQQSNEDHTEHSLTVFVSAYKRATKDVFKGISSYFTEGCVARRGHGFKRVRLDVFEDFSPLVRGSFILDCC